MPGAREELDQLRRQKRLQELEARVAAKKQSAPETAPAGTTPESSSFRRFGQGMADRMNLNVNKLTNLQDTVGRGILGAVGVDVPATPAKYPWSKEAIAAQEASAAPVADTTAGTVGSVAADAIMTAPLGAVGRGMQALEGAPLVGRLLGNRTAQAAVEGGLAGAMVGDPGARGEDIRSGMMTGAAFERGGRLLGRTLEGLVRRSPEAQALDNIADLHQTQVRLPLSTAASDQGIISPFAKFLYGKVIPALPGTSGTLAKQSQRAGAQLREIAMKEAAPGGMGSTSSGYAGGLPMTTNARAGAGSNVRLSMKQIQDAFDNEYKTTIKAYSFNQPNAQDFATFLQQKFPNIDNTTLASVSREFDNLAQRYSKNGVLDGDNLVRMKTQLANMGRQAGDDRLGQSLYQAQEFLDDVVKRELSQGNNMQNMMDLQRYLDLADPWRNFQRVQRAAARSKDPDGMFTPQELMSSVKAMSSDRDLARGAAPMQELASIGQKTVGQVAEAPTYLERGATWGTLAALGLVGGPQSTAAAWGIGRTAASPAVQDVLMGTTSTQKALVDAMRKRPRTKRMAGASIRNTMATEVADDEQE